MEVQTTVDSIAISAAVVALVQMIKWAGMPDKYGAIAVLALSLVGVALWGYSQSLMFQGPMIWQYFTGWINVALAAAGIFGFTRAGVESVSRMTPPPGGSAGSSATHE